MSGYSWTQWKSLACLKEGNAVERTEEPANGHYRVSLRYDSEGYWVAEHPELPGCVADGETARQALESLSAAKELWIESRLASGLGVPAPAEEPQYSGRFVLRIARSLHGELAQEAEAEGVSLNSYVAGILAARKIQRAPDAPASAESLRVA
jgi:antitoxin HicB